MASPPGKPTWQGHMAKPYGKAIWKAIWQSHMAEPYGRAIWQSHMAEPYGRGRGLGMRLSMETFSEDFDLEE